MAASLPPGGVPASLKPVFVVPGQLDFYLEDRSTHKRVMTLYNPYDTDVSFKVLCNNPKKYAVVEPEGRILAHQCSDIVVRHVAVSPSSVLQTDKFRIHIYDDSSPDVAVGKRDILATLHPGECDRSTESKLCHSSSLPHRSSSTSIAGSFPDDRGRPSSSDTSYSSALADGRVGVVTAQSSPPPPNYIACFAGLVCITALFLPTDEGGEQQLLSDYPSYLYLTVNQKLVFAYVLGLVTMAILRTT